MLNLRHRVHGAEKDGLGEPKQFQNIMDSAEGNPSNAMFREDLDLIQCYAVRGSPLAGAVAPKK
jgi:hypothetical protein